MQTPRMFDGGDELLQLRDEFLGVSPWLEISQTAVDAFASATGDDQWIHVDPVRAGSGPFGGTIAHGYLTLGLLPVLWRQVFQVHGVRARINYGLDHVRFPAPLRVGARARGRVTLISAESMPQRAVQARFETTVEIEAEQRPACVAISIVRYVPA